MMEWIRAAFWPARPVAESVRHASTAQYEMRLAELGPKYDSCSHIVNLWNARYGKEAAATLLTHDDDSGSPAAVEAARVRQCVFVMEDYWRTVRQCVKVDPQSDPASFRSHRVFVAEVKDLNYWDMDAALYSPM